MAGFARWAVLALLMALAACSGRVELFSTVTESEANEILAVLLDSGIPAQKSGTKDGMSISVEGGHVAQALDILRARGLPRESFSGMGQIFQKEGLVSSPLEERARYIYALSQELSNTLSQMDGVLVSRVHVVLPERASVNEAAMPSTAAVFIKHQAGYSLDTLQPQIRRLVTHAIPGLTEDRVSIVLVAAHPVKSPDMGNTTSRVLGVEMAPGSAAALLEVLLVVIALVLLMVAGALAWLWWRGMPDFVRALLLPPSPAAGRATAGHEPALRESGP